MSDPHAIRTVEALREVIDAPNERIKVKLFEHVDDYARAFIARAPLAFLATADADGRMDVSPKGDAPGFVIVEDANTLLVPDRPGNHLAYGFLNIVSRPQVALIFVVPGVTETLRINGRATITKDPRVLDRLAAHGKPAVLATRIHVEECFFHCGKAFIRSSAWQPETWQAGVKANIGKQLAARMAEGEEMAAAVEANLEKSYRETLY